MRSHDDIDKVVHSTVGDSPALYGAKSFLLRTWAAFVWPHRFGDDVSMVSSLKRSSIDGNEGGPAASAASA